ncbi:NAD(P)-dependent dehydrogenase (short-subunit alcohol dehydrogenase family) [Streptomyces olivoverticillatus]|uniref:NAD(P)-dependent dehydrogenase (Short-subunit alcohol dehydrogenase family) n=1 Tax=Streptomyces olivoverticillatus TaxID=66427 RepID=A0A7W7PJR1_9ACTN|nr:SDR family oxidoreductase [Streptomyces olivoverticillatus]MBB4893421.1 NAD(P)-dependent dehydrogenase (short-subunit alcohol dehydrogenase family) [Streptomyces olivoverticillatus]
MPGRTLKDKVVVIGGASRNLGSLIAREIASDGAKVVVHYNSPSSKDDAMKTAQAVKDAGGESVVHEADLTKTDEVEGLFEVAIGAFDKVDCMVNTAGMVIKKPMAEVTEDDYDKMFAVNSKAAFFMMREAAKRLEDGGKIVTVVTSLLAAYTGLYSVYAGSKSPVEHFTRALSKELFGRNISVNAVAPGPMDTGFFYPAETEDSIAFHKSSSMNGELTKIGDIAPCVKFLLTDGWWVNGQTLFVNGGYTTR